MLKRLFTSNARIKLLTLFLSEPEGEFFIRELTRKLDEQINSIRRELTNLKKVGILQTTNKNRKKYYKINPHFLFLAELTSIFSKVNNPKADIVDKIDAMGEVKLLVLSGIFVNQDSQIDLLLVGKINKNKLADLLEGEVESKQPVRFSVMDPEDFLYRVKFNDRFISSIVQAKDTIIAINRLQNQFKLDF